MDGPISLAPFPFERGTAMKPHSSGPILWFVVRICVLLTVCIVLISKVPPDAERDRLRESGAVLQLDEYGSIIGIELTGDLMHYSALNAVSKLTSLKSVRLKAIVGTNQLFSMIGRLPQVRTIFCSDCSITDDQLRMLQDLHLQSIDLSNCSGLTSGLAALERQTELKYLAVAGCQWMTDEEMQRLPAFPQLRTLDLRRTEVTDHGVAALARCNELELVDLSASNRLSDVTLQHLQHCNKLQSISIRGVQLNLRSTSHFKIARPEVVLQF